MQLMSAVSGRVTNIINNIKWLPKNGCTEKWRTSDNTHYRMKIGSWILGNKKSAQYEHKSSRFSLLVHVICLPVSMSHTLADDWLSRSAYPKYGSWFQTDAVWPGSTKVQNSFTSFLFCSHYLSFLAVIQSTAESVIGNSSVLLIYNTSNFVKELEIPKSAVQNRPACLECGATWVETSDPNVRGKPLLCHLQKMLAIPLKNGELIIEIVMFEIGKVQSSHLKERSESVGT